MSRGPRFTEEDFYDTELGEMADSNSLEEGYMELLRVPGGWVMTRGFDGHMTSTYIPEVGPDWSTT